MLSVQSVNLMKQPAFGINRSVGAYVDYEDVKDYPSDDYIYSKEDYSSDRSKLEKQLNELNEVIDNADIPKPIRTIGKLVSVGIGAALGFVSMRYGAQGVAKLFKNGVSWVKSLGKKEFVKNISENSQRLMDSLKKSKHTQSVFEAIDSFKQRYKATKLSADLEQFSSRIKNNRFAKSVMEKGIELKNYVSKLATAENIEKGAINLFAVSGGVTGGVTALQEVTKD